MASLDELEHRLHTLGFGNPLVELGTLGSGERSPAFPGRRSRHESRNELLDLRHREPGALREVDQRELVEHRFGIHPLPIATIGLRNQAFGLIEPDGRCGDATAFRNLSDPQLRHTLPSSPVDPCGSISRSTAGLDTRPDSPALT